MNTAQTPTGRKRPVNLSLSEDLVQEARALSGNLSATVEAMLTEYVVNARNVRAQRQREADTVCREWNTVLDTWGGSFADEYSTL